MALLLLLAVTILASTVIAHCASVVLCLVKQIWKLRSYHTDPMGMSVVNHLNVVLLLLLLLLLVNLLG
jgi:hypothetical protein